MMNRMMMTDNEKKPLLDAQIVENLRRAFNQTAEEAVPDRFLDLIRQLRQQDKDPERQEEQDG